MARRKIRNYPSTEKIADIINDYFEENKDEVINDMLIEVGFNNLNDLWDFECKHCGFGCDCGWVWVKTFNKEQLREWILDNGKYDAYVWGIHCPYNSQSTTLKEIQIKKALKDLHLNDQYYAYIKLD